MGEFGEVWLTSVCGEFRAIVDWKFLSRIGVLSNSSLADYILGGYFVQYDDGYQSWSPAAAFESGYSPLTIDPKPDPLLVEVHLPVCAKCGCVPPSVSGCAMPDCEGRVFRSVGSKP